MFNFLKKKTAEPTPEPKKSDSLFSTHIQLNEDDNESLDQFLGRVITRTSADFRPVDSDGNAVTSAMDASAGNVGALKPVLEAQFNVPPVQLQWYALQTFIGYQIMAIIAQHWLVDKACTMPARDAMRHGYELVTADSEELSPEVLNKIKALDKKYKVYQNCVEFARFNRIFGIRIAIFNIETNDPKFYEKPFNIDGVKPGSYKGISQIDPYWITPELNTADATDPASPNFYEPTWWRVNGKRYHRSHLILIRNGIVADILKPTYMYGGISIPQKIAERVYAAERTANEGPMLAMTKRTTVWHMSMAEAMANQAMFQQKMNWFTQTRDNYGVKAMGLQDVAEQFDTSLADLDDVIMTQYQLVSAIAEVPATKLLGTSPKGFNATGDFEADSYHEFLESVQTHDMEPLLERHYLLLSKSEGLGVEIAINWNPVDSPGAREEAEIRAINANTAKTYVDAGIIDGQDGRTALVADKDGGYTMLDDELPEGIEEMPETNVRETIREDDSPQS